MHLRNFNLAGIESPLPSLYLEMKTIRIELAHREADRAIERFYGR